MRTEKRRGKKRVQVESSSEYDEYPEMVEYGSGKKKRRKKGPEILKGRGLDGVWIIAFHLDNLSI